MDSIRYPDRGPQQGPMQPPTLGLSAAIPEPTFAAESLPGSWTGTVAEAAWQHAGEVFPNESMGFVFDGQYHRLENAAEEPASFGALSSQAEVQVAQMLEQPGILFVHSHPRGLECPSAVDMRTQRNWGIPFVVLPLNEKGPIGSAFSWGHGEQQSPLLHRPFRHGIFDCVTLIRDWYEQNRGIRFVDEPRDWAWWEHDPDQDLYRRCYQREGFQQIDVGEATQPGDVLFYSLRSSVPQHAAVVIDVQRILHHIAGLRPYDTSRRSGYDLRSRWHRFAVMAVRHA